MTSRTLPVSTMRPAYMTAIRSATSTATEMSCVTKIIDRPSSRCSSRSSSRICTCTVASSAVVGSSASRMRGLARQRERDHGALAHAARHLVRIGVLAAAPGSGCAPASAYRAPAVRASACRYPLVLAHRLDDLPADGVDRVHRQHGLLEHHGHGLAAEVASSARPCSDVTSMPSTWMVPSMRDRFGGCRRRIERSVTLLPEPDSPSSATTSPLPSDRSTPSSARTGLAPPPNVP